MENSSVLIKVSADATRSSQSNSITSFVAVPDVGTEHFQSLQNTFVFALGAKLENRALYRLISSMSNVYICLFDAKAKMGTEIIRAKYSKYQTKNGEASVRFNFVGDWMSLVHAVGCKPPGGNGNTSGSCPFCNMKSGEFATAPFKLGINFELVEFEFDLLRKPLDSSLEFLLGDYRYCWMHGSTRILCNTLKFLNKTIDKDTKISLNKEFQLLVRLRKSKDSTTNNLTCKEAKIFLKKSKNLRNFAKYFANSNIITPNQFKGDKVYVFNPQETVLNLLEACKLFMNFSYFPHPTKIEFEALDSARQMIIKVYADNNWRMVGLIVLIFLTSFYRQFQFTVC